MLFAQGQNWGYHIVAFFGDGTACQFHCLIEAMELAKVIFSFILRRMLVQEKAIRPYADSAMEAACCRCFKFFPIDRPPFVTCPAPCAWEKLDHTAKYIMYDWFSKQVASTALSAWR